MSRKRTRNDLIRKNRELRQKVSGYEQNKVQTERNIEFLENEIQEKDNIIEWMEEEYNSLETKMQSDKKLKESLLSVIKEMPHNTTLRSELYVLLINSRNNRQEAEEEFKISQSYITKTLEQHSDSRTLLSPILRRRKFE